MLKLNMSRNCILLHGRFDLSALLSEKATHSDTLNMGPSHRSQAAARGSFSPYLCHCARVQVLLALLVLTFQASPQSYLMCT